MILLLNGLMVESLNVSCSWSNAIKCFKLHCCKDLGIESSDIEAVLCMIGRITHVLVNTRVVLLLFLVIRNHVLNNFYRHGRPSKAWQHPWTIVQKEYCSFRLHLSQWCKWEDTEFPWELNYYVERKFEYIIIGILSELIFLSKGIFVKVM